MNKLEQAILLRENGNHEEAKRLLLEIYEEYPNHPGVKKAILFYSDKLNKTW